MATAILRPAARVVHRHIRRRSSSIRPPVVQPVVVCRTEFYQFHVINESLMDSGVEVNKARRMALRTLASERSLAAAGQQEERVIVLNPRVEPRALLIQGVEGLDDAMAALEHFQRALGEGLAAQLADEGDGFALWAVNAPGHRFTSEELRQQVFGALCQWMVETAIG